MLDLEARLLTTTYSVSVLNGTTLTIADSLTHTSPTSNGITLWLWAGDTSNLLLKLRSVCETCRCSKRMLCRQVAVTRSQIVASCLIEKNESVLDGDESYA